MECKIIILFSLIIIFSSCSEREKAQESTLIKKPQVQNFNYRKDSILVRNNYQKITHEQLPIDSVIKHLTEFTFSNILIKLDEKNYIPDTILANIGVSVFEKQISRFPQNLALRELKGILSIQTKQPIITKNELINIIK
uniref:hypothetical protein n=1 Tax=Flavobacterium filum TaxID=370974 RepID=UPI0023F23B1A